MERLLKWLSAGAVTVGVSAAMVAGAGVADADRNSGETGDSTSAGSPEPATGAKGRDTGSATAADRPGVSSRLRPAANDASLTDGEPALRVGADSDDTAPAKRRWPGIRSVLGLPAAGAVGAQSTRVQRGAPETGGSEDYDLDPRPEAGPKSGADDNEAVAASGAVEGVSDRVEVVASKDRSARVQRAAEAGLDARIGPSRADVSRKQPATGRFRAPAAAVRARLAISDVKERVVTFLRRGVVDSTFGGIDGGTANAKASAGAPVLGQSGPWQPTVVDPPTGESAAPDKAVESAVTVEELPSAPITAMATALRLPSLLNLIGSAIFTAFGAVTRLVGGQPVLPPGSTLTVGTSDLELTEAHTAEANWYFPDAEEAPDGIIYLQHGFLSRGPWYSYTAAYLAEQTNSVVVTPTVSSNMFAADGFWLGSDSAQQAIGALFLDDRDALNASALAAGYADQYGDGAVLPDEFVLTGHSLGGAVAGAAGFYAGDVIDSGDDNHLAGVVFFDGVPPGNSLIDALDTLDGLDEYVPVLTIGAPANFLSSTSTVNDDLTASRPGLFNGVVLDGGSHQDSLRGGNRLVQFAGNLVGGFPEPQNPLALQILTAGWINDMLGVGFDASTGTCLGPECQGSYGDPGSTIEIATDEGTATAVVIGEPLAIQRSEVSPGVAA